MKRILNIFILAMTFALMTSLVGMPPQPAFAAGIVVNSQWDGSLAILASNGTCELREAIEAANTNAAVDSCASGAPGADTITFAGNYTITVGTSQLNSSEALTINGNGAALTIIQASPTPNTAAHRVLLSSGNLTLNNLTIRNGRCNGQCYPGTYGGGGVNMLGSASLTVSNSTISNNTTDMFGGGIQGGSGAVTVTNSTISGNSSAGGGGGISSYTGGLTVTGSTFSNNSTNTTDINGGGILSMGVATVTNTTFSSNTATGNGGAISSEGGDSAPLTVANSTFSGNSSTGGSGGGISATQTPATITNSTFSGNTATTTYGGGIFTYLTTVTVTNSTFSGNSALIGGGVYTLGGTPTLKNTIIANSTSGGNCGGVTADSYNLATDATCNSATQKTSGQINLGALASNGGSTQTFALLTGSAALNTGDDTVCAAAPVSNLDQRGTARPQGAHCDVGSFEKVLASTKAITAFSFTSPAATGVISGTNIALTVPSGTDVTALVATFTTTGASVTVGATAQVSGTTANDFTNPVIYTVIAEDGTTQNYTVTVKIAPAITSIVPNSGDYLGGMTVVITGANLTGGTVTFGGTAATCTVDSDTQITCTSPAHDAGAVDVAVTTTGGTATSTGGFVYTVTETVSDGETQSFASANITIQDAAGGNTPGLVTVSRYNTAPAGVPAVPDGQLTFWIDIDAAVNSGLNVSLTLCYSPAEIPVGVDEANLVLYRYSNGAWTSMGFDSRDLVNHCVTKNNISAFSVWTLGDPSSAKDITAFSFTTPAAVGVIGGTDIAVTVPFGTNVTALAPTITHTGASVSPANGAAQDFTNPVTYTVTAEDSSTQDYTVTVAFASNNAPVAVKDTYAVSMSGTLSGTSALANDSDADANSLTAIKVSDPIHSSAFAFNTDGTFTYTPVNGYQGVDTFTYKANDGAADSNVATVTINITPLAITLQSTDANDGWVLESSETSSKGDTLDAAAPTFNLGDDAQNRQYRAILSFDTSSLPNNAVITKVTLRIKRQSLVGTDPFTDHYNIRIDIRKGSFSGNRSLQPGDFEALPELETAGRFLNRPLAGNWYLCNLYNASHPFINAAGATQFRLYFARGDNNDLGADYLKFFSGNATVASYRPQLIIEYYVPTP